MSSVLKVSDAASLALHAAAYLAKEPETRVSTAEIARALKGSEAHLAKVLRTLERAGLVGGKRGPGGGFTLAREARSITLKDVYEAVEGPIGTDTCLFGESVCDGSCILGDLVGSVAKQVASRLAGTRLSEIDVEFGNGLEDTDDMVEGRKGRKGREARPRGRRSGGSAAGKGGGRWRSGRSSGSTKRSAPAAASASRTARKGRSRS